jgi:hypothetical protein
MGRGVLVFALLVTGGLTLLLGRPATPQRSFPELQPIVVSAEYAETVISSDTLRRGEVLAQLMARVALTPEEAAGAIEAVRAHVNPRTSRHAGAGRQHTVQSL